ncbi:transcriptional regulator [Tetragenococcus halophilus subsp. flandriensis]|uniref:helix-turn-helix domain-containing protein n=1 Tax=Tetragenococcus halophilus TaxID=51669 RepID=UPI0023E99824|nr:helix-turn-helix transcriptional regulator [Tetragenococcus halophilus]GMA06982.1 transcriptional regulator [Tetragenococcus halophilus subsp. flandriensis]
MFPEKIKELRKSKKFTQKDVAEKIGITRPAYTAYEIGKRQPDFETLQKIADLYEVSIDYLLGREEIESLPQYTSVDLDKMLDSAMSFDGKPMTDNDREVIRAYLEGKFGSN